MNRKTIRRMIFVVFLLLIFAIPSTAVVLHVPGNYPSIAAAIAASGIGDTILLAPGGYYESNTILHSLTIGSSWLMTGDSASIDQVILHNNNNFTFYCDTDSGNTHIRFAGVTFTATDVSPNVLGVIEARNCDVTFDHIKYNSPSFTSTMVSPIFQFHAGSNFTANDCDFQLGIRENYNFIESSARNLTFNRCRIEGRDSTDGLWIIHGQYSNVFLDHCYLRFRGYGIISSDTVDIRNTTFYRTGAFTLYLSGRDPANITDCLFEELNVFDDDPYWAIYNWHGAPNLLNFTRCTFMNCSGFTRTNCSSLLFGTDNSVVTNCRFIENRDFQYMIHGGGIFDSTQFVDNSAPLFANHFTEDMFPLTIESCDFIGTTFMTSDPGGHQSFSPLMATDCYWGDSTGPQHVTNPTGQGMRIPNYAVYTPFRTSPVFPVTGMPEPHTNLTLPTSPRITVVYPNPFNSSTTIRYSLPQAGEATIAVYDVTGRVVTELRKGYLPGGEQTIRWLPMASPSGRYFVRISSQSGDYTHPITYLK